MAVERLRPLYSLLKQKILSSEYIQVDESVIPVMEMRNIRRRRVMSGACVTASRETSCSIMTGAAVRAR